MRKKTCFGVTVILALALMLTAPASSAWAQAVLQTPIAGSSIPQFVDPLPTLDAKPGGTMQTVLDNGSLNELYMREFVANILPTTTAFLLPNGTTYAGTHVFGYIVGPTPPAGAQDTYIGPVFVSTRYIPSIPQGFPTEVKYVNNLGQTASSLVPFWTSSVDQTLHWANPAGAPMTTTTVYEGPIPAVPHLHGGEVPAPVDGGPDAWFLSEAAGSFPTYKVHGDGFYSRDGNLNENYCIYRYPNSQEAGPLWFHDHLLGGTRLNVYAGLAGAYLLTDPSLTLPAGMTPTGLLNGPLDATTGLPTNELTIPLVLQDRMFDTNGELYFPNVGINPEHPFWIPEFVGDTIVVNGKSWPFLTVDPKRYRFLMINGSNARFYELNLGRNVPMYVIGTDGGYLDFPVQVNKLVIGPGERYQLIIDFNKYAGKTITMTNTGRTPFPKGAPPQGSTLGNIVQFRVNPTPVTDNSYDPGLGGAIRASSPIVRLAGWNATTHLPTGVAAVTPTQTRQLTLNEVMGPGGPLEILVNNTKWGGRRLDITGTTPETISTVSPTTGKLDRGNNYLTELPAEGTVEQWEIINLTADAHPIHLHLVQFQILNRQNFNVNKYMTLYNGTFPAGWDPVAGAATAGGVFVPAYGPPADYFTPNADGALGGNPPLSGYLQNKPVPPDANEAGWKDTAIMYPGQVTRILVRYTPTDNATTDTTGYPFEPNFDNYSYVWHCHIVDHEDNEMMRPYQVTPDTTTTRTYTPGTNY
jgi:spore coat protein A